MESNQSDENYEEFHEERSPSGRKVFVRTKKTTTTTKTQKSIATSSSQVVPVPLPRQSSSADSTSTTTLLHLQQEPPGVCSNITTIVFREGDAPPPAPSSLIDSAADFLRLESLARHREEATTPGGLERARTTTTTVHHRTVTHLNKSFAQDNSVTRPVTLQMHSSDNDSLLEDTADNVHEESATFQNIHKFTSTYESTPVSSPMSSSLGHDRFTSGDSLYQQRSFVNFASPMGSPLSGSSSGQQHGLATDDWKFSRTHQYQTRSGFYRSISQYDSHIKEIRGEAGDRVNE